MSYYIRSGVVCLLWLCCMLGLFFFFKQKTAYEMRISDWSSDVCSSDLCMQHVGTAVGPARLALEFGRDERDDEIEDREVVGGRVASGLRQIGRASCRERVCQYV